MKINFSLLDNERSPIKKNALTLRINFELNWHELLLMGTKCHAAKFFMLHTVSYRHLLAIYWSL